MLQKLIDRLLRKNLKAPLIKNYTALSIVFPFPRHSTRWNTSFGHYPGCRSLPISTISPRRKSLLSLLYLCVRKITFYPPQSAY